MTTGDRSVLRLGMADDLPALLARLAALFPPHQPLTLRPSAGQDAWAPFAERFDGGHARRWFAATDGQGGPEPVVEAYSFYSLEEAGETMRVADEIRAQPEGYWVEPHWLAIAGDGAGQHFMIDDRDGRVLAVAHDDDHVAVVAESPEAWLATLIRGAESGDITWDATFGLTATAELLASRERQERAREAPSLAPKHRLGLALTMLCTMLAMGILIWWLETNR